MKYNKNGVHAIEIIGIVLINKKLSEHINKLIDKNKFNVGLDLATKFINDCEVIK